MYILFSFLGVSEKTVVLVTFLLLEWLLSTKHHDKALCELSFLIHQQFYCICTVVIPILQMRRLRLREVKIWPKILGSIKKKNGGRIWTQSFWWETCSGYFITVLLVDDIFYLSIMEFQTEKITWKLSKLTSSYCKWEEWVPESLCDFPKVIQWFMTNQDQNSGLFNVTCCLSYWLKIERFCLFLNPSLHSILSSLISWGLCFYLFYFSWAFSAFRNDADFSKC